MRSAKEEACFPYSLKKLCYIEVSRDGAVFQLPHRNRSDRDRLAAAYYRALSGESALYAVWPGEWTSDLFAIDDLDAFAKALRLFP